MSSRMHLRAPMVGVIWAITLVGACTTEGVNTVTNRGVDYRPIVDMKNIDRVAYERDLLECKEYALQVDVGGSAAAGAIFGAMAGAAMGAAVGSVYNDPGRGAAIGATGGGLGGLGRGAISATTAQEQIVRRCLIGRGYPVLY